MLKTQEMVHQACYVIQPQDTYVRVKMRLPNLTFFYLNPITSHETTTPTDQVTAFVNWPQTILFYVIYLLVIVCCVWYLIRKVRGER